MMHEEQLTVLALNSYQKQALITLLERIGAAARYNNIIATPPYGLLYTGDWAHEIYAMLRESKCIK